jgi:rubrerythrin
MIENHHHHHAHEHVHGDPEEMRFEKKLETLFSHWIDHNNSHQDNYLSWAKKARDQGFEEIAQLLEQAGALSRDVTQQLEKALESLAH